jgi:Ca2+/H+ antiporter, TMEM165/GDT1 family
VQELLAYLTVLVAAAIPWLEVLLVVPAGIVAGLPPVPVAVVAAVGNVATLVPLVLGGDRLRAWWRRRRGRAAGDAASGRSVRARRLFDRFGLPGLAALGPLVTGIHVAAVVALAAGADRRRALGWMTAGVVVWAAIAAAATVFGLDALIDEDQLPDLGLA